MFNLFTQESPPEERVLTVEEKYNEVYLFLLETHKAEPSVKDVLAYMHTEEYLYE